AGNGDSGAALQLPSGAGVQLSSDVLSLIAASASVGDPSLLLTHVVQWSGAWSQCLAQAGGGAPLLSDVTSIDLTARDGSAVQVQNKQVEFTLPLVAGADGGFDPCGPQPECRWFDHARQVWSDEGC